MAGTIIADTLTHSTAGSVTTDYVVNGSAKMWCIFNGTGTVAILDSINSASLTDGGTGNYDVNYTNAFSSADNYVSAMSADENNSTNHGRIGTLQAQATSSGRVVCALASDLSTRDMQRVHKINHGDLA